MLPLVDTPVQKLDNYRDIISEKLFDEIEKLSRELKGLHVSMINSTPQGGGVAEILKSLVPLIKGLGIKADWYTIPCPIEFFDISKKIHNALQGQGCNFPLSFQKYYFNCLKRVSFLMKDMSSDVWVIHDHQPMGLINYLPKLHPSVSRLHIDLSSPNKKVWNFIAKILKGYDKVILTSKEFIQPEINEKAIIFPPGIDPLTSKNQLMEKKRAQKILANFGISFTKPLISQVARFDIFKDPLGVIAAYKMAKKQIPDLQLIFAGLFLADDDPEAEEVYEKVKREAGCDDHIFLFSDLNKLKGLRVNSFVSAIQSASQVILQNSLKEGFGLTVTEAMWKERPVIANNVGGIKLQIKNGKNGFLVESLEETSQKIVELIKNPNLAKRFGRVAKETVRKQFLMPRVLRDYLKVFYSLIHP